MSITQVVFYLLSASLLTFAFLSVTTRKVFRAAIYLLFSLIGVAGLYFILKFEFIAAVQIVVYVGGIVVLIIFAVFLTHRSGEDMLAPNARREWIVFILTLIGFALSFILIQKERFLSSGLAPIDNGIENIGLHMLDIEQHGYILPFEVVSILLLAAMIGAIVIAMRETKKTNS